MEKDLGMRERNHDRDLDQDQDWRGRDSREGRKGMRRHICLLSVVGAALRRDPTKQPHPNRGINPLLQLNTTIPSLHHSISSPSQFPILSILSIHVQFPIRAHP